MANITLSTAQTTPYFLKENETANNNKHGYAYMGDLGLSISNTFAVTSKGQVFLKEGILGGVMPEYKAPGEEGSVPDNTSAKLADWTQGWKFRENRLFTRYIELNDKGEEISNSLRYSCIYNDYIDTTHYLCFGSPLEKDFTKAAFRVTKTGDIACSEIDENDTYEQGYGTNSLKVTSWRSQVANNEEKKYQTVINPNSIYFYSRHTINRDSKDGPHYHGARITYVPGAYGHGTSWDSGEKTWKFNNGHFINFSCSIGVNSILLSPDRIRYFTTSTDDLHYTNVRHLYLGPSRADRRASRYEGNGPNGYTILRGRALMLQAYGGTANDKESTSNKEKINKFNGRVMVRAGALILQNTCEIRALKKGWTNPSADDDNGDFENTNILIRLGTEKKYNDDKTLKVNEINRVVVGGASNTASTEVRSPDNKGIYLKTNGVIKDDSYWVLYAGPRNFGTSTNKNWKMVFRPQDNGKAILGGQSYKWKSVYTTQLFNDSDERLKDNIKPINENDLKLFDSITPISYTYNELSEKDEKARQQINFGYSAQNVSQALKEIGLTDETFAGILYNQEEGQESYYSLDYTKFVALNAAKIKQLESVIQTQSAQIQKQQEQIDLLLSKLV